MTLMTREGFEEWENQVKSLEMYLGRRKFAPGVELCLQH